MKTIKSSIICLSMLLATTSFGQLKKKELKSPLAGLNKNASPKSSKENVNESYFIDGYKSKDTVPEFKPSFQVGGLMHYLFQTSQSPSAATAPSADQKQWGRSFELYRARLLFGANISPKGSFFMETEIPILGGERGPDVKFNRIVPFILDCQYHHDFSNSFQLVVGKQLVSPNRNGLQGAASLMANDFTHYQYAYNMTMADPLQGDYGRDLGVNTRGFFLDDRLEYRLGVFAGRMVDRQGPYRVVGRLAYNFLDTEKDYYYAGTKLGQGKTFAVATGLDAQADYMYLNADTYLDVPVGPGSITANAAFGYMDGGSPDASRYSFSSLIPRQTVQFLELGYYLPSLKIQPWIKYENQNIMEDAEHYGNVPSSVVNDFNALQSNIRLGGGLNYFFSGYNANFRLSYTQAFYGRTNEAGTGVERASVGQVWAQLQFFFF